MFKLFVRFIPLASLGLLIQALMAWFMPESEVGHSFLKIAGTLFMVEFIFMHSEVFHNARKTIFKNIYAQYLFSVVLFLIYGVVIWESAHQYPWVGVNYLALNIARLVKNNEEQFSDSTLSKLGLDRSFVQQLPWVISLLKAGGVMLGIPLLVVMLPLPDAALSIEKVQMLVPEHNDPRSLIILVKVFAIYFAILVVSDTYKLFKYKLLKYKLLKPKNYS